MTFAVLMITLVQATNEDHHISLTGFLHRLCGELSLRAGLIERTAYGDAVIALDGITDIAPRVVTLNIEH